MYGFQPIGIRLTNHELEERCKIGVPLNLSCRILDESNYVIFFHDKSMPIYILNVNTLALAGNYYSVNTILEIPNKVIILFSFISFIRCNKDVVPLSSVEMIDSSTSAQDIISLSTNDCVIPLPSVDVIITIGSN
ncbi:hypothetical protein SynRS9915_00425 [Synechococcus sp. RS9915]|nr:hypothetical protein SynRS9915_00425 [Synechococcus sp. RS9915]